MLSQARPEIRPVSDDPGIAGGRSSVPWLLPHGVGRREADVGQRPARCAGVDQSTGSQVERRLALAGPYDRP